MAAHRTSVSLPIHLYDKAREINAKLLLKHKTNSSVARLLSALLHMYEEKTHGEQLRSALNAIAGQDGRTIRHQKRKTKAAPPKAR